MKRRASPWSKYDIDRLYEKFQDPTRLMDLELILGKPADEIVRMIVCCSKRDPVKPGRVWDPKLVEYYVRRNIAFLDLKRAVEKREEDALTTLVERREGETENMRERIREFILVGLEQKARELEARERQLNEREGSLVEKERRLRIEGKIREMVEATSGMQGLELGYDIRKMELGPEGNYLVIQPKYDFAEKRVTTRGNFRDHIRKALRALGVEGFYENLIVSVGSKDGKVKVFTRKKGRTEDLRCFLRAYEMMLRREVGLMEGR